MGKEEAATDQRGPAGIGRRAGSGLQPVNVREHQRLSRVRTSRWRSSSSARARPQRIRCSVRWGWRTASRISPPRSATQRSNAPRSLRASSPRSSDQKFGVHEEGLLIGNPSRFSAQPIRSSGVQRSRSCNAYSTCLYETRSPVARLVSLASNAASCSSPANASSSVSSSSPTTWTLPAALATSSGCTLSASVILMRRRSS